MTSIIKNQIIKHLSKFARNITADQISVQILSGKGELKNIELNEAVISEVLELPTWLQIERAVCNRIAVKVPWTRLKSQPVQLFIDEIHVEVELSSKENVSSGSSPLSAFADSSYGFANRVAEGMSLYVNSVEINFDSGVFRGSLTLSRLAVESRSPGWQPITDLRYSRIVDPGTNKLLMFKMVTWQLLRIEASAQAETSRNVINAPLRLITSSGKSRISVKKSTADGSVLGGRIQVILDDILWIATLPQIRSAITFYDHIMNIVKTAPKKMPSVILSQQFDIKIPSMSKSPSSNPVSSAFRNFDFEQTSYHVYVGKIDLHLCDDNQLLEGYPEDWDILCGALQVTLLRLSVDFYPANSAISDRSDWVRYDNENQCAAWIHKVLQSHLRKLCTEMDDKAQTQLISVWPKLMSQNCVIRMHDIVVQCVTDMDSKKEKLFNLFMSDRKSKTSMPSDKPLFHLEFASFYHPSCNSFPLPSSITHLLLGPFFFLVDQRTIRWVLFVIDDIKYALQISSAMSEIEKMPKTYLRIDLLMPKIILPLNEATVPDTRLPRRIVLSMSTVLATNCEAICCDNSRSFFESISPNVIDFIDSIDLLINKDKLKQFIIRLNESAYLDADEGERFWLNTSPVWIDTDFGEETPSTPLLADVAFHVLVSAAAAEVNVALQPLWRVRAAVNHFQFIQIMRISTCISAFVDQLVADQKCFSSSRANGNGVAVGFVCFIEEAELSIILPSLPVPTPYVAQGTVLQSPTVSSNDISEESRPTCLIAASSYIREQKFPATATTIQKASLEVFPEFPQQIDSEAASATDETMSVTTNISEDEQQSLVFDAADDDIFSEEVAVAEEAFADEVTVESRKPRKDFTKQVNVMTVLLSDLNVIASTLNNAAQGAGYITKILVQQSLHKVLGDLYAELNSQASHQSAEKISPNSCMPSANFRFFSPSDGKPPSVKAQVQGVQAALDDIIVTHLSAFIYDDEKNDVPLNLKISLKDTQIVIRDPKVKPLRIKLNDCVIEQTTDENEGTAS